MTDDRASESDATGETTEVIERVDYDEFSMFAGNAEDYGLTYDGPPTVRRESVDIGDGRQLSALVWGTDEPQLVLLHGGAQNAHTWDTFAMALGRPLVAIDLPGHGHSDGPAEGARNLMRNADDVVAAIRALAPKAKVVVGMSLGGLTATAVAAAAPELVAKLILVDITPGVTSEKAKAIHAFVNGPENFPSFEELLARTMEFNPTRSESSLRRGILHNAEQRPDGSWVWRYARHRGAELLKDSPDEPLDVTVLWDAIEATQMPIMLVRGMAKGSVVDDGDETELLRRRSDAVIERVEGAGHSVQGDKPVELAAIVEGFAPAS